MVMVLLLLNYNLTAQDSEITPLDNYLRIAAENNPELRSMFNQYLAALERVPQDKGLPDPTVAFGVFISPVETRVGAQKAGISINQAFPWFGQLGSQESTTANIAKARFELFEDKKNELFFKVQATYYSLYVLEAAIAVTQENLVLLNSFRELANVKLESAKGNAVDLLRVEMDLSELENQMKFLEDSRLPLQAAFKELLNTENRIEIQVPDTLITTSIQEGKNELLDSLLAANPSLRKYDFEIDALDSEMDASQKMGLPSFNLGLSYLFIEERVGSDIPDNGKDAIFSQVGVRIPLWGKKYSSRVTEKELLKLSKTEEKADKANKLNTALEQTWRDYMDAQRRVRLYMELAEVASRALDILVVQYTSANTDFEEMLRMDRQLLRYELELEKARADQNIAVARINYLTGKNLQK